MKFRRSPQEKKVLSYARDGRSTFAESCSKGRAAVAKRKVRASRALRRAETVATTRAAGSPEEADLTVTRTGRRSWRKIPDAPLAEYVDWTLARRAGNRMNTASKSSQLLRTAKKAARPHPSVYKGPLQEGGDD